MFENQSSVFRDMFLLPPPSSKESIEEGGSVSNPIRLDGVKKTEFESFLRVLFPLDPLRPHSDLTKQDWLDAIKLATMWEFGSVRQVAINSLDQLPFTEVERILILNEFDINEWKPTAYTNLVLREDPLSAEDIGALGAQLAAKFSAARERFWKDRIHYYDPGPGFRARGALHEIFGDEIPYERPLVYSGLKKKNLNRRLRTRPDGM